MSDLRWVKGSVELDPRGLHRWDLTEPVWVETLSTKGNIVDGVLRLKDATATCISLDDSDTLDIDPAADYSEHGVPRETVRGTEYFRFFTASQQLIYECDDDDKIAILLVGGMDLLEHESMGCWDRLSIQRTGQTILLTTQEHGEEKTFKITVEEQVELRKTIEEPLA